jgi:alpha-galactosidase
MATTTAGIERDLAWGNAMVTLHITTAPDAPPALCAITLAGEPVPDVATASLVPVVEVSLAGDGKLGTAGKRHVDGAAAQRLRLCAVRDETVPGGRRLTLELSDDATLAAEVVYELADGATVVRTHVELTAIAPVAVEHVSSFALGGLFHGRDRDRSVRLWRAANPWSGEYRWGASTLGDLGLVDVRMTRYGQVGTKNRVATTSTGAWSTSEHLPLHVLDDGREQLFWQVENNGAWHTEVGDRHDGLYLLASGPTWHEHQWRVDLSPGESFRTADASFGVTRDGWDGIGAALTGHRRRAALPHPDHVALPIVFNDFLNGLMSDPTTDRVLPLVEAAADLGVDVYCMDAGWYDDEDGGWWDSVGEWRPSVNRFPGGGLDAVMDRVHALGLGTGLWLEPEVVGRRSALVDALPPDAFFSVAGHRTLEWGRHQLDLRHPAARAHLDGRVDDLVRRFRLDYLKLDYNIDIGPGTDGGGRETPGHGLLQHSRAHLGWVRDVMRRHDGLTIEGCAAGGSRGDGASAATFPLLSLTDQQDHRLMPPIVAGSSTALTPEQSGVWASVDGSMTDEDLAFSLCTSMLGRIHLAGRIDTLSERQRTLVRSALDVYRGLRDRIPSMVPFWPAGLPGWHDDWLAYGLRDADGAFLVVWRRGGPATWRLALDPRWVPATAATVVFPEPASAPTTVPEVTLSDGVLDLALPAPAARLVRLTW